MFLVSILRGHGIQCLPKWSNTQLSPLLFPTHFESNAKVPPRFRHSASVLSGLSKAPDSGQAEVFHSFLLDLHLHQALTQLLLSPRCLCLPAELQVNLQLLWLIVSICKEGGRALLSSLLEVLFQEQLQGLVEDGKLRKTCLACSTQQAVYVVL